VRTRLLILLVLISQTAFAAEKAKPAADAYANQTSLIAYQAVVSQLKQHPERLNGVFMKLKFQIDPQGRVHNVKIISRKPNRWAEETARHALNAVKFPPASKKVFEELGTNWVNAEAQLGPIRIERGGSGTRMPATEAYVEQVGTIVRNALIPELARYPDRLSGAVRVAMRIDRRGHIDDLKIVSTKSNRWVKDTATRVVHTLKLPEVPREVAAEQGRDWVDFQAEWSFER
jgi:TonB family protein